MQNDIELTLSDVGIKKPEPLISSETNGSKKIYLICITAVLCCLILISPFYFFALKDNTPPETNKFSVASSTDGNFIILNENTGDIYVLSVIMGDKFWLSKTNLKDSLEKDPITPK